MEFTRIILKPMHTEKTFAMQNGTPKRLAFFVEPKATKNDIKIAFASIYGITPDAIATQNRKPAAVRSGTKNPGFSKLQKIAIITLPQDADLSNTNLGEEQVANAINAGTSTAELENLTPALSNLEENGKQVEVVAVKKEIDSTKVHAAKKTVAAKKEVHATKKTADVKEEVKE
ncbi:MAG: 50S ribosomal protein L23 [Mycoplasmataceae bacterium]|jgi:large subunit ribosomal protein L23|nr:50S ribosomal protein L23 [Mycoplasmataceae bacterium]